MNQTTSNFYSDVQRNLDQLGQEAALSADERDIVDDYANQDFGALQCAEHIAKARA